MAVLEPLLARVWGLDNSGGSSLERAYVQRLCRNPGDDAGSPKFSLAELRVGFSPLVSQHAVEHDIDPRPAGAGSLVVVSGQPFALHTQLFQHPP